MQPAIHGLAEAQSARRASSGGGCLHRHRPRRGRPKKHRWTGPQSRLAFGGGPTWAVAGRDPAARLGGPRISHPHAVHVFCALSGAYKTRA